MEISRKIEIKFNWWCDDENIKEIDFDTLQLLEGEAEAHICKMRLEGYTSGELFSSINDTDYRGWWDVNYV